MFQKIIFSIFVCLLMCQTGIAQKKSVPMYNRHVFKVSGSNIYTGKWILKDKAKKGIRCLSCHEGLVYITGKGVRITHMIIGQNLDVPYGSCGARRVSFNVSGHKFLYAKYRQKMSGGIMTIRILEAVNSKTGKKVRVVNKEIRLR